jgi:hypothetical protein
MMILEKVDLVITNTPAFQILIHNMVLKFKKIWLSGTLNIIRKPRKSLFYLFKLSHIAVYHKIQVKFDNGVFHIYRS